MIASSRYPVIEPFAGGLEACVWHLARTLVARGHHVTLFAGDGSDPELPVESLPSVAPALSEAARRDVSMPHELWMTEHHSYLNLMISLAGARSADFDVVHNHSLHYLPVAMAPALTLPMLSTLHTPPTPWLESGMQAAGGGHRAVAVSRFTADSWQHAVTDVGVVLNGIDLSRWPQGRGGGPLVWSGRLVPEKGADLAVAAARLAGWPIELAGPIGDHVWFDQVIAPLLGPDVTYVGHLDQAGLAAVVGRGSACLVTPRWDEPYGLVVAESLACGTPVLAFRRGGIPEVVDDESAMVVAADDVAALAAAVPRAVALDRDACRRRAVEHCSIEVMVDRYEEIYAGMAA